MSKELLPCPFCGGRAALRTKGFYFIWCYDCGNQTGHYFKRNEAITAWNRREPIEKFCKEINAQSKDFIPNYEEDDYDAGYSHALGWVLDLLAGKQSDAE